MPPASSCCLPPHSSTTHVFCLILLYATLMDLRLIDADASDRMDEKKLQRLCGRLLIDALKSTCNHNYFQPSQAQLHADYYNTVRAKRSARRSITHDCCINKCSLHYLKVTYCAAPASHYAKTGDGSPFGRWQSQSQR